MTAFRNFLVVCGAALGAEVAVRAVRWLVIYPITGLAQGKSASSAVIGASCSGVLVGILAGLAAGLSLQTSQPGRWSFLLAALVWWCTGTLRGGTFPDAVSYAAVSIAVSAVSAAVALGSFFLARRRLRSAGAGSPAV